MQNNEKTNKYFCQFYKKNHGTAENHRISAGMLFTSGRVKLGFVDFV